MSELAGTITERRRLTRNSVYNFIYESEVPPNKQEISKSLSLSLPTVHQNIRELMDAGLIRTGEAQKSTGGRRPVGYEVILNVHFAVGISVTADHMRFLATDLRLGEIAYKKLKTGLTDSNEIARRMAVELEKFLDENHLERERLLGVGITLPAVFDETEDRVRLSPSMQLKNISLRTIREHIPYRTYLENDGSSGGFAEWFPIRNEKRDLAYLYLENGVGGAIFIHGEPYFGVNKRSGEFGHMCVKPDGRPCRCGKNGCLEAYVSASRITAGLGVELDEFFEGIRQGNRNYSELWDEMLKYLAIGIANIRKAFDCDIVVGGFLSQYLEPFLPELRQRIAELDPFQDNADYVQLGRFPKRADMMGVAWHFIKEYIESI